MKNAALVLLLGAACSPSQEDQLGNTANTEQTGFEPLNPPRPEQPLSPPAPGQPGGLPDDRTPLTEGPIDPTSAQGAGQVLQRYFALLEQRRYVEAYRLWSDSGKAAGEGEADFVRAFAAYREFHANIGAPGQPEGAAGSIYVEVPVQLYGRTRDGREFNARGTMTLRRANDVPGSSPEQREWRIYRSDFPRRL